MKLAGKLYGSQSELENVVIDIVDSLPSNPVEGQIVWHTGDKIIYLYNGNDWNEVFSSSPSSNLITGNLEVTHNTTLGKDVYIKDNMVILNYGETSSEISQWGDNFAGIEIDRGTSHNVKLFYDEGEHKWCVTNDGISSEPLAVYSDVNPNWYLHVDGTNSPEANINWGNYRIVNLGDPVSLQDAATKNYVDNVMLTTFDAIYLRVDNGNQPNHDIDWSNHKITNLDDPTNDQDAVNKRYVDFEIQNHSSYHDSRFLKLDGSNTPSSDISWNNNKITNLKDPTSAQDAATKNYVDNNIVSGGGLAFLKLDGSNSPTTDISWSNNKIIDLKDPTNAQDAATKNYVDNNIIFGGSTTFLKLDGTNTPTADISMNSHAITNLSDPTNAQDAATKNYVDYLVPYRALFISDSSTSLDYININITDNARVFCNLNSGWYTSATSNGTNDTALFAGGDYSGGSSQVVSEEYVYISTPNRLTTFGNLNIGRDMHTATSNGTDSRAIIAGGKDSSSTVLDSIEYQTLSSTGNASIFGSLTLPTSNLTSASNGTNNRGLFAGGVDNTSTVLDKIEYINIGTLSNGVDFGDLTVDRYNLAATSNFTEERAVFIAGQDGASYFSVMDYVTISTLGNATGFGATYQADTLGASSNGTGQRGIVAGGNNGTNNLDIIHYFNINALANSIHFGLLTSKKENVASTSNA